MVTPFALRLKIKDVDHSGALAGRLYAISTIGSIIGTFSAGFLLIAIFGSYRLILILALVLLFTAIIAAPLHKIASRIALLVMIIGLIGASEHFRGLLAARGMHEFDTAYHRGFILDVKDKRKNIPVRLLMTDPLGSQSAMDINNPANLVADYTEYYRLADHFAPGHKESLLIGGGAYTFPRYYLAKYPESTMDVVEIDPGLTKLAEKHFGLTPDPRLNIIHQDARIYLNNSSKTYDVLYIDVFGSSPSIPFQLVTKEALQLYANALNEDGVLLMNIISAIEGDAGRFLRAGVRTFKEVFPHVFLFTTQDHNDGEEPQNLLLAAIKSDAIPTLDNNKPELKKILSTRWEKAIAEDMPILTDDFAPVEFYMLSVLNKMHVDKHRDKNDGSTGVWQAL